MLNKKDVILACDFPDAASVFSFLDNFKSVRRKPFVKIGMELFYSEGAPMVREIRHRGHPVFLDLKLHDIPNTVRSAMKVLAALDVDMVNVHAAGGSEMMRAAREGLLEGASEGRCPKLIAVTQLTSTSEQMLHDELLIGPDMPSTIISYARNAAASGLDGVVCSPLESSVVHANCPEGFLTVTPGVRFAGADHQDQKRVMTPSDARKAGSDFIVVGRPVTRAADPLAAYERCIAEFLNETLI